MHTLEPASGESGFLPKYTPEPASGVGGIQYNTLEPASGESGLSLKHTPEPASGEGGFFTTRPKSAATRLVELLAGACVVSLVWQMMPNTQHPAEGTLRIPPRWQPELELHPNDDSAALFARSREKASERFLVGMWD